MGRNEDKAFKVLMELAAEELAKATHLCSRIADEEAWIEFDRACLTAYSYLLDAYYYIPSGVQSETADRLWIGLKEISDLRLQGFINWQMARREAEAVRNPRGRYGHMKAQREMFEGVLAEDGNGHHSPKS